jgi:hypothetical protein
VRRGEEIAAQVSRWLAFAIPANYRAIEAARVARALCAAVPARTGQHVLLSGEMQHA